jgi:hypothetical protein
VFSRKYSCLFALCPLLMLCCRTHDASDVRSALAGAASALEGGDAVGLFPYIDERTRFALASTVKSSTEARALIEAHYPEAERAGALTALGDRAQVSSAAELFERRCGVECMRTLAAQVGVPVSQEAVGDELRVTTNRGGTLHMFAGSDGRFGIVWNTAACALERSQTSRDLTQIRENAAVYRKRRELSAR